MYNFNVPNLEWSVLWRVHAQLEARVYTWRLVELHDVPMFTILSVNEPFPTTVMILECAQVFPPHGSIGRSNLGGKLLVLNNKLAEPRLAGTTEDGKLNEAGHLVTH